MNVDLAHLTPPIRSTFVPDDWSILAQHWYPVAIASDIGDAPVSAMLLDEPLVLYRTNGSIIVARDVCPHRGVPLSMGKRDGETITCAYHGLKFGAKGRCVHIPANPSAVIAAKLQLITYPAVERYGLIWTCLAKRGSTEVAENDTAGAPDIPVMPHWDEAGFQQINCPVFDIAGFAGRQMEGFLDVAHFGWIHTGTFGDPENTEVPAYSPVVTDKGFIVDYRSNVGNYPVGADKPIPEGYEWLRHFEVHLPFTATLTVHFPGEGRLVIMNAASPVSARKTRLFAPIARNFDLDLPVSAVHEFNRRVFEEDRWIVEAQRPEWLPLDPSFEAHIPADRSSIAYRKGLRGMGLSTFFTA
ncbi:(2Fe-2S)-binding protein [Robbsia andropogonis]|uniref:(2Fe-2S)-binding protein n=1 Tax=Robbsia andropogonis TaxID=28092 RepID=A0A0F5JY59_9BURK|nr:aromatic ring-hydroxylating dioxygenase subunit alpha [Robbsia andropogonis]KKB62821.1 (2Fe-2S)-binding protein [Robbsia andropogonis]MCP1118068.1 aromatic ring-hydroxylating dioxygenase subunit alpha [Robbsia andropogonis]MCP1127651.1 aromatic ring-hydroxylating dioxygenase subunit alpha [Robbsia andropogonis]